MFGSDDVYSENGLDLSAAVSKRIICGLSKYGSMTRHMPASIPPLNSFMAKKTMVDFLKTSQTGFIVVTGWASCWYALQI